MEKLVEFEKLVIKAAQYFEGNIAHQENNEWHVNMVKTKLVEAVTWAGQAFQIAKIKEKKEDAKES